MTTYKIMHFEVSEYDTVNIPEGWGCTPLVIEEEKELIALCKRWPS